MSSKRNKSIVRFRNKIKPALELAGDYTPSEQRKETRVLRRVCAPCARVLRRSLLLDSLAISGELARRLTQTTRLKFQS